MVFPRARVLFVIDGVVLFGVCLFPWVVVFVCVFVCLSVRLCVLRVVYCVRGCVICV